MTRPVGTLIIAEKPSAARAIADALGGFKAGRGYLASPEYLLTWASGHLVQLADAERYDPRYKRWRLEDLPIVPKEFMLVPVDDARLAVIAALARDATEQINACDAGREGELIFGYIYRYLKLTQPVRRLWAASLTREGIREAFAALRPGEDYVRLYRAAECRSHGDWLTGINATRAFSRKFGDLLSVGRVQTPTLAMIVQRDREIAAFVPKAYWEIKATFATEAGERYEGIWQGTDGRRVWTAEEGERIVAAVQVAGRGRISSVERKETAKKPPQLFDLTSLQREANRRFGLTAAATLAAAQALYESKLITYPRTDSRYLTHDVVPKLPALVKRLGAQPKYADLAAAASPGQVRRWGARVLNDAGVGDHHAIIPTGERPDQLGGAAARIYDLVTRRTLMQFYPEATYAEGEIVTEVAGWRFVARGRQLLLPGWRVCELPAGRERTGRRVRGDGEAVDEAEAGSTGDADVHLPVDVKPGDEVAVHAVEAVRGETEPPRPFTDATLLLAMETAGRALEDEELREAMKRHGLGTPATRAAIIERLREVGYLERVGRTLRATPKGEQLIDAVAHVGAAVLLSPELTGEWERRIADVQSGDYDPDRFEQEIIALVRAIVGQVATAAAEPTGGAAVAAGNCPLCGHPVMQRGSKWSCTGDGCAFSLSRVICGRVMRVDEIGTLLRGERTEILRGFRSKAGKPFAAALRLNAGELEFIFAPPRGAKRAGRRGGQNSVRAAGQRGASGHRSGKRRGR